MTMDLRTTSERMSQAGKGILAADESTGTIGKRFASIQLDSTEENRRCYRELLFTTPGIGNHLYGAILFEETLTQKTASGQLFSELLLENGILPGIKVDKGLIDLALSNHEQATQGLDGLPERLATYKDQGAYFAKWRAVYHITDEKPSLQAIETNAELLARYAAICQSQNIVPIVEPEVLINGTHTIERCYEVTDAVQKAVFIALERQHVQLEHIILKPSMVISGQDCPQQATPEQVAELTVKLLKDNVPAAVPTIAFLSGGQTDEQASLHLQLINSVGEQPWQLSFSYGRALQSPCIATWKGSDDQRIAAQQALYKRCKLNSAAERGQYTVEMESETVELA